MSDWQCFRSGDCCTQPRVVEMTHTERREVEAAAMPLGIVLHWRAGERPRFTNLVARPCPFFGRDDDGQGLCKIYEVRPYSCRRFMCGREKAGEHFMGSGGTFGIPLRVLKSADLRAQYARNQDAAKSWADAHGWKDN